MNYIFIILILSSIAFSIFTGNIENVNTELFEACTKAVKVAFGLIGIMAFWLGIVNVARGSGLCDLFSKIIRKPLLFLFPDLKDNNNALSNIAMNISANAFGLSNAATPFGIKAMENMQEKNEDKTKATNSMCTFLAINTAGFQIVPASVIAILASSGMENPSQIILPTLIVTSIAFISAIIYVKILERFFNK